MITKSRSLPEGKKSKGVHDSERMGSRNKQSSKSPIVLHELAVRHFSGEAVSGMNHPSTRADTGHTLAHLCLGHDGGELRFVVRVGCAGGGEGVSSCAASFSVVGEEAPVAVWPDCCRFGADAMRIVEFCHGDSRGEAREGDGKDMLVAARGLGERVAQGDQGVD